MGTIITLQNISKFCICHFYKRVNLYSLRTDEVCVSTSTILFWRTMVFWVEVTCTLKIRYKILVTHRNLHHVITMNITIFIFQCHESLKFYLLSHRLGCSLNNNNVTCINNFSFQSLATLCVEAFTLSAYYSHQLMSQLSHCNSFNIKHALITCWFWNLFYEFLSCSHIPLHKMTFTLTLSCKCNNYFFKGETAMITLCNSWTAWGFSSLDIQNLIINK